MGISGRETSQIDRERMQKMRSKGLSIREIARAHMVSTATVQKNLKITLAK